MRSEPLATQTTPAHVIADAGSAHAGPTLIAVGGIHGNEPAGPTALERVARALEDASAGLRGRFLALRGHTLASTLERRFVEHDLNRLWTPARIERLRRDPSGAEGPDEAQMAELLTIILDAVRDAGGRPVHFVDLHTTSADSVPFALINDSIRCRDFALGFPVPVILGLEEHVEGTITDFAFGLGCVSLGFEAGQHLAPDAVELHEAAVWVALSAAGICEPGAPWSARDAADRLRKAARRAPRFVQVTHRHEVVDPSSFRMEPGFENFSRVGRGQLLARENSTELRAERERLIFMPLYQAQGDDGYFLVEPVSAFWLWLSRRLRKAGLPRLVHLLPGVRRDPDDARGLVVDPRIARFVRRDVFHLLGFRKLDASGPLHRYRRRD